MIQGMLISLTALTLTGASHAEPANGPAQAQLIERNSSYVSSQANEFGIRTRLDVAGSHFTIRAVGHSRETGRGSHDGGRIQLKDEGDHVTLGSIGIRLPKAGVDRWNEADLITCDRLALSGDAYSLSCIRSDDKARFGALVSKKRGVLSFTGFCWIMPNNTCEYVLISAEGIALR